MDFEEALDDEHFDMHTGEPCIAEDNEWFIIEVEDRNEWKYAY